jgi:hypothetical protein
MTKDNVTTRLIEESVLPKKWHMTAHWMARVLAFPLLLTIGWSQLLSFFMPVLSVTFLGGFIPLTAGLLIVPTFLPLIVGVIGFVLKGNERGGFAAHYVAALIFSLSLFFVITLGSFLLPLVSLTINIMLTGLSLLVTLIGLGQLFNSQNGNDIDRLVYLFLSTLIFSAFLLFVFGSAIFFAGLIVMPMAVAALVATAFFPLVAAATLHIARKIAFSYRAGRIEKATSDPQKDSKDSKAFQHGYSSAKEDAEYFFSFFKPNLWFGKGAERYYEGYRAFIDAPKEESYKDSWLFSCQRG